MQPYHTMRSCHAESTAPRSQPRLAPVPECIHSISCQSNQTTGMMQQELAIRTTNTCRFLPHPSFYQRQDCFAFGSNTASESPHEMDSSYIPASVAGDTPCLRHGWLRRDRAARNAAPMRTKSFHTVGASLPHSTSLQLSLLLGARCMRPFPIFVLLWGF